MLYVNTESECRKQVTTCCDFSAVSTSEWFNFLYLGPLELVGFDAADEEGLTRVQRGHESLQGFAKLQGKGEVPALGLAQQVQGAVFFEQALEERVVGHVHKLLQVHAECVTVLLQEA